MVVKQIGGYKHLISSYYYCYNCHLKFEFVNKANVNSICEICSRKDFAAVYTFDLLQQLTWILDAHIDVIKNHRFVLNLSRFVLNKIVHFLTYLIHFL